MKKISLSTENPPRRTSFGWIGWLFLATLLSCGALVLPLSTLLKTQEQGQGWVPFGLHSVLSADYSAEASLYRIPAVGIGLIAEVMRDQSSQDTERRMAEIERRLEQPIPSVTPRFTGSGQPTSLPITPAVIQPSATTMYLPTRTPLPTASSTLVPTGQTTATATPIVVLPSPTSNPGYTAPTLTPVRPKPTKTQSTQLPPTQTPFPTDPPPPPPPVDPPYPGPDPNPQTFPNPYP